jgi:hypothetical protein
MVDFEGGAMMKKNVATHLTRLGVLLSTLIVLAATAIADPAPKALGELLVGRDATLNGAPAASGLTVLSGSRIKTSPEGRAIINLGELGRVTLGPDSEMVLDFSGRTIGGELVAGWAAVSAPKGVEVAIRTAEGTATAEGAESSVLTIDVSTGATRVEVEGERGASARLGSGEKSEVVAAGEEVELSRASDGVLSYAHRQLEGTTIESRAPLSLAGVLAAGVRRASSGVTLNRVVEIPDNASDSVVRSVGASSDPRQLRVRDFYQRITCGEFGENCADCSILPFIIKAKAGCSLSFIVRFINVRADSYVTVRPFFNTACFRIFPGAPNRINIPPGGSYPFQIDARLCPRTANQSAANRLVVIETEACGTRFAQVEWTTPCL